MEWREGVGNRGKERGGGRGGQGHPGEGQRLSGPRLRAHREMGSEESLLPGLCCPAKSLRRGGLCVCACVCVSCPNYWAGGGSVNVCVVSL